MLLNTFIVVSLIVTVILSTSESGILARRNTCAHDAIFNLKDTREIVKYYGYPIETHLATSQDGYITTLFRIPHGIAPTSANCTTRHPALLFHGAWSSSNDWFLQEPERNLPFILAENCSDVWLVNARGTTYSQGHVTLDSSRDQDYWDFSFDEMGRYDVPVIIDLILKTSGTESKTSSKLDYIGQSMGCAALFICLHYHPEYNDKIGKIVELSPAAFMGNLRSPFMRFSARAVQRPVFNTNLARSILFNGRLINNGYGWYRRWVATICQFRISKESTVCSFLHDFIGGRSNVKVNGTVLCRLFSRFPESVSASTSFHFAQLALTGRFESQESLSAPRVQHQRSFHHFLHRVRQNQSFVSVSSPHNDAAHSRSGSGLEAKETNLSRASIPYNLGNTKIPVLFMVGLEDSITPLADVYRTFNAIGSLEKKFVILPHCNHLDISLADDSQTRVFYPVRNYLSRK